VSTVPTIREIRDAARRIEPYAHRTPILTCRTLNDLCHAELFFKCENFQKAGAFKIRGATNAVFSLGDEEAARGVATHSSGNYGAALALAARWRGIKAHVVVPRNAPPVKVQAMIGYGAEVTYCEPTLEARERGLDHLVARTGATFLHPYNNYSVIAGQGTAALELCEQESNLDSIVAPVGGGGTAIAASALSPRAIVLGAEPEQADDAYRSFHAGRIIPVQHRDTIADGLRTSLGTLTFPIIREHVTDIVRVSEAAIVQAMRLVWERMKIVVEPSAAVPLAGILTNREAFPGNRIGVILSGGNVDLANLPW
jgi:threonine dehydratase